MERLQGPINPLFIGKQYLDVDSFSLGQGILGTQSLRLELEEEEQIMESHLLTSSLFLEDNNMPFLQMLQSVELPTFFPLKEPNFQALLKLQHLKIPYWDEINTSFLENEAITSPKVPHQSALELASCVTTINAHDNMVDHFYSSPVKSDNFDLQNPNPPSFFLELESSNVISLSTVPINQEKVTNLAVETTQNNPHWSPPQIKPSLTTPKERKKRKRTRRTKNMEEVESQRMTHIAVERNRRRLMNEHLSSLRSLLPPSYLQRGDQASIIGGAINFVKELEQLLQTLEAQKRMRTTGEEAPSFTSLLAHQGPRNDQIPKNSQEERASQVKEESKVAEIEIASIQNHVKLKVHCQRNHGQLLRAIAALEELKLTVLHLNVSSSGSSVLYTFNVKIEEECKLRSTDEVAAAVDQIFTIINSC